MNPKNLWNAYSYEEKLHLLRSQKNIILAKLEQNTRHPLLVSELSEPGPELPESEVSNPNFG